MIQRPADNLNCTARQRAKIKTLRSNHTTCIPARIALSLSPCGDVAEWLKAAVC